MKILVFILTAIFLLPVLAETSRTTSKLNSKLKVFASDHKGEPLDAPKNWLRFYTHEDNTIENRIYITASFNLKNVTAVAIIDVNAEKNKCGVQQKKFLSYLAFKPEDNVTRITTRIGKPCFIKNKTILKLNVKTSMGERYYNILTLSAHPEAFEPVSN